MNYFVPDRGKSRFNGPVREVRRSAWLEQNEPGGEGKGEAREIADTCQDLVRGALHSCQRSPWEILEAREEFES